MDINVLGRNVKITERLETYVDEKVTKFEQLERVDSVEVKFSKDGHSGPNTIRVEITVVGSGPVLRAEAQGEDKFAVFDDTYGKLLERLRRARDRRKISKGGQKHPVSLSEATGSLPIVGEDVATTEIHVDDRTVEEAAFDSEFSLTDEVTSPIEIRRKRFPATELSAEEAVDQMELVGHDFFLFVDKETKAPSVAYRRKGWSYGVITLDHEG